MSVIGQLIVELVTDASKYESGLAGAEGATQGWAGRIAGVAGNALAVGVAGAATAAVAAVTAVGVAAFNVSRDTEAAANDIAASLGIPIEKAEEFADVAQRVYGNNFADSVGDAADAVKLLAQQIDGLGDDSPGLQRATEHAFALRDVFDVDVAESIDAVDTLMENFGLTSDQAFDLVTAGFQKGLNRSGDFLDTIGEYSTQFAEGGASAEEFFGLLESGLQGGVLGTDKAADAFKEFRLRINDGSDATREAVEQLFLSSEAADQFFGDLQSGTTDAAGSFGQIIDALNEVEDPIERMQIGTALLGTQFEDLGDSAALGLNLSKTAFADVEGAADSLNVKYETLGDFLAGMWRRTVVAVTPLTDKLLELANESVPYLEAAFESFEQNVVPAIESVTNAISTVYDFVSNLFTGDELSAGIGGNIEILDYFKEWFDTNLPLVQTLVETVLGLISGFWEAHGQQVMDTVTGFLDIVMTIIDTALKNILDLVTLTLQILTGDWEGAGETIQGIATRNWEAMKTIFDAGVKLVQDSVRLGMDTVVDIITGIAGRIREAGAGIVRNLQDGISAKWDELTSWFSSKLEALTSLLPFSPPRDSSSPLVRLPAAGEGIVNQIQAGINRASLNIDAIAPDLSGLGAGLGLPALPDLAPAAAGNGSQAISVPISITINGPADAATVSRGAEDGVLRAMRRVGLR
ncbi:MAG: phage tail tape measure protein [Caldilineaceae bacterium]